MARKLTASNVLFRIRERYNGTDNKIYCDNKKPEQDIRYFKQIEVKDEPNYDNALTTIPYIAELKEPIFNKSEPFFKTKRYKNYNDRFINEKITVGQLPRQLINYYKYSED